MKVPPQHPILSKQYAIFTPAIDQLAEVIGDWIEEQATGGYIWGPSRYGKSRAVQYFLSEILSERFGKKIPLVIVNRTMAHNSAGAFFSDVLRAAGQKYWGSRQTPRKKEQMAINCFLALAKGGASNTAILLIDEAQTMTDKELIWLTGLQNEIENAGVMLTVIQIGSHQLDYVHSIQALTGNAHVSARFFVRSAQFHGISSIEQVEYVLIGYENDSEWPANSRTSFTEAFGMRPGQLTSLSQILWETFVKFFPKEYIEMQASIEIPMQHFARTVEAILKANAAGENWDELCSEKSLAEIIAKTALDRHLQLVTAAFLRKKPGRGRV
ncbi:ATP-binding protein [Herbaspirillum huttiense]|uniref:ATP-binding protein n=1 Tax=Herbaspirillum huttiense TaxID=863372 RepID=UPI0039B0DE1D